MYMYSREEVKGVNGHRPVGELIYEHLREGHLGTCESQLYTEKEKVGINWK